MDSILSWLRASLSIAPFGKCQVTDYIGQLTTLGTKQKARFRTFIMPTYAPDESPVVSGTVDYNEKYSGTLYITSRRLFFEQRSGRIRRRDVLTVEIPWNEMTSVSIEKGPWNWSLLVIAVRDRRHKFVFRVGSPETLMERIKEFATSKSSGPEHTAADHTFHVNSSA